MPEPIGEVQTKEEELRPPTEEDELDIKEPEEVEDEFPAFEKRLKKAADDKGAGGEEKGEEEKEQEGGKEEEGALSADLLKAAEEVGFSAEEAKAFDTPEALQNAITVIEKRIADMGRKALESESGEEAVPPETKKETKTETGKSADELMVEILSKEDELDSIVVGDLKTLAGAHNKLAPVVRQLVTVVSSLLESERTTEDARFDADMDATVKELGEDWQDVFGKKAYSEMSKAERKGHENYHKLLQEMLVIGEGRSRAGLSELDTNRLAKKALPLAFPEKLKSGARKEVSKKLKNREKLMGNRPTHRKGKELKGEELAVSNLAKRMRERGGTYEETEIDFPE